MTCAASFSRATRRLPNGLAATKSRLPRCASPASVPDRARIDQSPTSRAKNGPYFQVMKPPMVSTSTGLPAMPAMTGGTVATRLATSCRISGLP